MLSTENDLKGFLPKENVVAFQEETHRNISSDLFFQWLDSFSHHQDLLDVRGDILEIYFDKFICQN
jgi:hypothetical protein